MYHCMLPLDFLLLSLLFGFVGRYFGRVHIDLLICTVDKFFRLLLYFVLRFLRIFYLEQSGEKHPEWTFIGENYPGVVTHWMPLPEPPKED